MFYELCVLCSVDGVASKVHGIVLGLLDAAGRHHRRHRLRRDVNAWTTQAALDLSWMQHHKRETYYQSGARLGYDYG